MAPPGCTRCVVAQAAMFVRGSPHWPAVRARGGPAMLADMPGRPRPRELCLPLSFSPPGRCGFFLAAKPTLGGGFHVGLHVVVLPRDVEDALAIPVHISFYLTGRI